MSEQLPLFREPRGEYRGKGNDPMNLREVLRQAFDKLSADGQNVIRLKSSIPRLFQLITSPNEFVGPLVEAWAHIHLPLFFDEYTRAPTGSQAFSDAIARLENQQAFLNIKAKAEGKESRSRINMSSLDRFTAHYSQENPASYQIVVFAYNWKARLRELIITISELRYCFDILEVPEENLKIESAFEGSYRMYVSPIPPVAAMAHSGEIAKRTPQEFVALLAAKRDAYIERKAQRRPQKA